jgi:hypothetical protein
MTFIVVPQEVGTTTATVWVGAAREGDIRYRPVRLDLGGVGDPVELAGDDRWKVWQTFKEEDPSGYAYFDRLLHNTIGRPERRIAERFYYQRVELEDLTPQTSYDANLIVEGLPSAGTEGCLRSCSFRTLPTGLPEADSGDTFNILLGSCFYRRKDPEGRVGRTFAALPSGYRPDVKFLSGDQVYLDNPWHETTLRWYRGNRKPGVFREMLLDKYLANWTQRPDEDSGLHRLLADGANYFCSDDHEFWNNAPSFGGVGFVNTLSAGQRGWWFEEARKLFRVFQSRSSLQGFNVGNLSFKIADTRIDRDTPGIRFMLHENLEEVKDWISSLEGPGVLVIGQPLLEADATETRWSRIVSRFDKDLAAFGQYAELKEAILDCEHSLVVLTGDVHFGRVASTPPGPEGVTQLVEVISSPMCLVAGGSVSGYKPALGLEGEGMLSANPFGREHRDHFATIRFSEGDYDTVNMAVSYWPIQQPGADPAQEPAGTFKFKLR